MSALEWYLLAYGVIVTVLFVIVDVDRNGARR